MYLYNKVEVCTKGGGSRRQHALMGRGDTVASVGDGAAGIWIGLVHALFWSTATALAVWGAIEMNAVSAANEAVAMTAWVLVCALACTAGVIILHASFAIQGEWWSHVLTAVLLSFLLLGFSLASCMFSHAIFLGNQDVFAVSVYALLLTVVANGTTLSFLLAWLTN